MGLTAARNQMENPEKKMDIKSLFSTKASNSNEEYECLSISVAETT